ncbi:Mitochondrial import inner membrane translocase subunit TIM44-2 [Acorus calamus]|uniref:Mitochondrial import inner membrane translocase subunit TIM44-2 n=1 Tax=Acorus calamus TaxID=4465 RepID=A0AAV9C3N5_ACOCL|nr:Mitochondrial import inner membrane translocase subunit TIM44-2 [Acorus calamus]
MMKQLTNRKKGLTFGSFQVSKDIKFADNQPIVPWGPRHHFLDPVVTGDIHLGFGGLVFFYRIFEKLKSFEPATSPTFTEDGEDEGRGMRMGKRLLRSLALVFGCIALSSLAYTGILNAIEILGFYIPLFLYNNQATNSHLRLTSANPSPAVRRFSIFNEFSKQVKGEAKSNPEFQQSVKELKEKTGVVAEDLKIRTKQTTEKIYKRVDDVWTEAEATAKREGFTTPGAEKSQETQSSTTKESPDAAETLFIKFKSTLSSVAPTVSSAFQTVKETKVLDVAKKGYGIVKDELSNNPTRRRRMRHASTNTSTERSTRTEMVVVPVKQSPWSKKWETFKQKMQGSPVFKRLSGLSEPVVSKSQELAEDMRERWETSDHPVVHKIQDLNVTVFGESDMATSFKEIRRRDPSFSRPEFLAEVQEMIKPTIIAYLKCDVESLKKNCFNEVIERCKAEQIAYEAQGIFFDTKILHISDAHLSETRMVGNTPIIIITDSIETVHHAWVMQLVDAEELGENAMYPTWKLREMQRMNIRAII